MTYRIFFYVRNTSMTKLNEYPRCLTSLEISGFLFYYFHISFHPAWSFKYETKLFATTSELHVVVPRCSKRYMVREIWTTTVCFKGGDAASWPPAITELPCVTSAIRYTDYMPCQYGTYAPSSHVYTFSMSGGEFRFITFSNGFTTDLHLISSNNNNSNSNNFQINV